MDGNGPFTECQWDLTAKSVTSTKPGIYAVPIDLKKIILPEGSIRENYIDGVSGNRKDVLLMLLESDPEFILENRAFNLLGEHPDSFEFRNDFKNRIDFIKKFTNETGISLSNNIEEEVLKAQSFATREISFSRANIIMVAKYGEIHKLLQAAIMNNKIKRRYPLTGLNYVPELKQQDSWLYNRIRGAR